MTKLTRQELYEKVWAVPATALAKEFGFSITTLRDVCIALDVPRPDRGYWAKLSHGKKVTKASLSDDKPNSPIAYVTNTANVWYHARYEYSAPTVNSAVPSKVLSKYRNQKSHGLLRYARESLLTCEKTDDFGYFRYRKANLPYLLVGASGLDKAIAFANRLFSAFENSGCPVRLKECHHNVFWRSYSSPISEQFKSDRQHQIYNHGWQNPTATVVWVGCVPFVISIFEQCSRQKIIRKDFKTYLKGTESKSKSRWDYGFETTQLFVDGRIGVQIESGLRYENQWTLKELELSKNAPVKQISDIVTRVVQQAPLEVSKYLEYLEEQKVLEEQRQILEEKRRLQRERERIEKIRQKAKDNLLQVIKDWSETDTIHQFFDGVEERVKELRDPKKSRLKAKLKQARRLIGERDPMEYLKRWNPPVK